MKNIRKLMAALLALTILLLIPMNTEAASASVQAACDEADRVAEAYANSLPDPLPGMNNHRRSVTDAARFVTDQILGQLTEGEAILELRDRDKFLAVASTTSPMKNDWVMNYLFSQGLFLEYQDELLRMGYIHTKMDLTGITPKQFVPSQEEIARMKNMTDNIASTAPYEQSYPIKIWVRRPVAGIYDQPFGNTIGSYPYGTCLTAIGEYSEGYYVLEGYNNSGWLIGTKCIDASDVTIAEPLPDQKPVANTLTSAPAVQAPATYTKSNFPYTSYADMNPDVKALCGYNKTKLWNHYEKYGKAEGRTVELAVSSVPADFDFQAYADKYPDLKTAFGYNPELLYMHWTNAGQREGRTLK